MNLSAASASVSGGSAQQAWNIICRIQAFARLLTLLVAVTGLRIGEVLALRWKHVDWNNFRIRVVSDFVRGKFGEPNLPPRRSLWCCIPCHGLAEELAGDNGLRGRQRFHLCLRQAQGQSSRVCPTCWWRIISVLRPSK